MNIYATVQLVHPLWTGKLAVANRRVIQLSNITIEMGDRGRKMLGDVENSTRR